MDRKEERHLRVHRPIFRRGMELVVVKPVRVSSKTVLEPGTILDPARHPEWHRRSLYRRGYVGPKDHAWTQMALEKTGHRLKQEAERHEVKGQEAPSTLMDWLRRMGILAPVPEYGEHEGAGLEPTGEN